MIVRLFRKDLRKVRVTSYKQRELKTMEWRVAREDAQTEK
jgi:hypothetical protein